MAWSVCGAISCAWCTRGGVSLSRGRDDSQRGDHAAVRQSVLRAAVRTLAGSRFVAARSSPRAAVVGGIVPGAAARVAGCVGHLRQFPALSERRRRAHVEVPALGGVSASPALQGHGPVAADHLVVVPADRACQGVDNTSRLRVEPDGSPANNNPYARHYRSIGFCTESIRAAHPHTLSGVNSAAPEPAEAGIASRPGRSFHLSGNVIIYGRGKPR